MTSKTPTAVKTPMPGAGTKLIDLSHQIARLLEKENTLLEANKANQTQQFQGEKVRLMAEYRQTMNHLQVNEHLLGPKNSSARAEIRKATDFLQSELAKHARIVLRLKAVTEGLVNKISEEVNKNNKQVPAYTPSAAIRNNKMQKPTSIAVNQVI